jgi:hypothetical protein
MKSNHASVERRNLSCTKEAESCGRMVSVAFVSEDAYAPANWGG